MTGKEEAGSDSYGQGVTVRDREWQLGTGSGSKRQEEAARDRKRQ